jgi:hypothetical protein
MRLVYYSVLSSAGKFNTRKTANKSYGIFLR